MLRFNVTEHVLAQCLVEAVGQAERAIRKYNMLACQRYVHVSWTAPPDGRAAITVVLAVRDWPPDLEAGAEALRDVSVDWSEMCIFLTPRA